MLKNNKKNVCKRILQLRFEHCRSWRWTQLSEFFSASKSSMASATAGDTSPTRQWWQWWWDDKSSCIDCQRASTTYRRPTISSLPSLHGTSYSRSV